MATHPVAVRSTRRRLGGDAGQSLVEFAVASTVFFATVFGLFSFGLAVYRYNLIANLAQEGARRASVCGTKKVLGGSDCDVASYVSSRAVGLAVTTVTTPIDLSTLGEGDSVTVRVQDTFRPLSGFVPGATMTLRSTATMIVAR